MMQMLQRPLGLILCGVLLVCAASCGPQEPEPDPLEAISAENYPRIDGSRSCLPLLAALYARACDTSVELAEMQVKISGGTGAVWRGLFEGISDMAIVYEAPNAIREEFASRFDSFDIEPLALDGLVFITHKDNLVESLTQRQLVDIYTGVVTNWSEVGGEDLPIIPYQRNEESGSQTLFRKLLMKDIDPMQAPYEYYENTMSGLIDQIASFNASAGALGFSVYYYADIMYANPNIKILSVDGISPSPGSLAGSYPLANAFYLITPKNLEPETPEAILRDWLLSPDGTQLLADNNYVPANRDAG